MKKTLASCKRFIVLFYVISLLLPVPFIIMVVVHGALFTFGIIFLFITAILSFSFILAGLISMRLYTYKIDNHEVICFDAFHSFMIVDEQVVDRAWASVFHPPVLSHKMGDKQLEYSHRRLKVNGEMVLPSKK